MKKYLSLIMLVAMFVISSCKKLEVNVEKTYIEEGAKASSLGFGGIILTLMPDGKADFLNGGDVVERTTYTINGNKVVLGNSQQSKFKVISDTELRYEDDRILKLDTN